MCGIAGILSGSVDLRAVIAAMGGRIAHRGPDATHEFFDEAAGLALCHRRLSIIDLSSRADQPMSTPDGRYTIVFNGEIYNYQEIRAELEAAGETGFTTTSDTEVLLRAYARWGEAALPRLAGMFAFAIWDARERRLLLARDRLGKKPLVWARLPGGGIAFASELKALAVPGIRPTIDPAAAECYFALGYVPAPLAILRGVSKLRPGHLLRFGGQDAEELRYWHPEQTTVRPAAHRTTRIGELRRLMAEAVRIRLRADVPIGLFLSGGIDSSVVAAECVALGNRPHALTVRFDTDDSDLVHARMVADRLGLDHEVVDVKGSEAAAGFEDLCRFYDEPFADSSALPSLRIAEAVAGRFKVILNGDGGDEAFGGYRHYERIGLKQGLKRMAAAAGRVDGNPFDPMEVYFAAKALFRRAERLGLMGADHATRDSLAGLLGADPFLAACPQRGALGRALWGDRHVYLPHDLLYKMDIALMAHGLEGRSPFLDHQLMEWSQGLPAGDLVQGSRKKVLLAESYRDCLPTAVLDRPKQGFGSPVAAWMAGPLAQLLGDTLPCPLLDAKAQADAAQAFRRGEERSAMRLWAMLTFALWARESGASWG